MNWKASVPAPLLIVGVLSRVTFPGPLTVQTSVTLGSGSSSVNEPVSARTWPTWPLLLAGDIWTLVGPGTANVNWSDVLAADVPLGVVTATSLTPAACTGAIAEIEVAGKILQEEA